MPKPSATYSARYAAFSAPDLSERPVRDRLAGLCRRGLIDVDACPLDRRRRYRLDYRGSAA